MLSFWSAGCSDFVLVPLWGADRGCCWPNCLPADGCWGWRSSGALGLLGQSNVHKTTVVPFYFFSLNYALVMSWAGQGLVGLLGPPGGAAANTLGCGALGCAWLPALVLNGLSWIFKILFRLYLNINAYQSISFYALMFNYKFMLCQIVSLN